MKKKIEIQIDQKTYLKTLDVNDVSTNYVNWLNDYETMKSMIMDGGTFNFEDGTSVTTGGAFVAKIEEDYQNAIANNEDWGWKTDYAFAAYPDGAKDTEVANQKGQWVNAQFRGKDGSITMEWYHIHEGKIIYWYQANGKPVTE